MTLAYTLPLHSTATTMIVAHPAQKAPWYNASSARATLTAVPTAKVIAIHL